MRQVARRLAWPLLRLLPSSLILEVRRRRYLAALRQQVDDLRRGREHALKPLPLIRRTSRQRTARIAHGHPR